MNNVIVNFYQSVIWIKESSRLFMITIAALLRGGGTGYHKKLLTFTPPWRTWDGGVAIGIFR